MPKLLRRAPMNGNLQEKQQLPSLLHILAGMCWNWTVASSMNLRLLRTTGASMLVTYCQLLSQENSAYCGAPLHENFHGQLPDFGREACRMPANSPVPSPCKHLRPSQQDKRLPSNFASATTLSTQQLCQRNNSKVVFLWSFFFFSAQPGLQ